MNQKVFDLVIFPILLPFLIIYLLLAYLISVLVTFTIVPSVLLAKKLNWAIPFLPFIWKQYGTIGGNYLRISFEGAYCINLLKRFLTLPLRPYTPDFYIIGFPKAGTTSLANHLKRHPAIGGLAALSFHEVLNKESHFFNGVFGPTNAHQRTLYRSFFPTIITRWWAETVRRVPKWKCFDASPVPACLPYCAQRIYDINPHAKIIIMLREPVSSIFSAEIMMRNMGVPLQWSLMEQLQSNDQRFIEQSEDRTFWKQVESLKSSDPLPTDLPEKFFFSLNSYLRISKYYENIKPFVDLFPSENIMFIEFKEFVGNTEGVVNNVLEFVDVEVERFKFKKLPAGMKTEYKGRRIHPSVERKLQQYFKQHNKKLYEFLGVDFGWDKEDV